MSEISKSIEQPPVTEIQNVDTHGEDVSTIAKDTGHKIEAVQEELTVDVVNADARIVNVTAPLDGTISCFTTADGLGTNGEPVTLAVKAGETIEVTIPAGPSRASESYRGVVFFYPKGTDYRSAPPAMQKSVRFKDAEYSVHDYD